MSFQWPSFTETYHTSLYPAIDPSNPQLSAKGKVILVTGGGTGVGKAIALAFATAGARAVVLLGRARSTLEEANKEIASTASCSIHLYVADVSDAQGIEETFKDIKSDVGVVDVFVSNAGYMPAPNLICNTDINDYWKAFEVHVKGTLICAQNYFRLLLPDRGDDSVLLPTFISMSTVGVHLPSSPMMSAYVSSKIAAWKMVGCLAAEMKGKARIFSVNPGSHDTQMSRKVNLPGNDDSGMYLQLPRHSQLTVCRPPRWLLRVVVGHS